MVSKVNQEVTFLFSPESRLNDIMALLDSYAVEAWKDGLVYFRAPLHFCKLRESAPPKTIESVQDSFPTIDKTLDVRLIQYEPPIDDDFLEGIRERYTRWPFYVQDPLRIMLYVGDQWWDYIFSPGRTYQDRQIVP